MTALAFSVTSDFRNEVSVEVQRVQIQARRAREIAARHDAEVDEHGLQQLFDRLRRIDDEREERPPIQVALRHAADRGLADALGRGQHDQPLFGVDRFEHRVEHVRVRR